MTLFSSDKIFFISIFFLLFPCSLWAGNVPQGVKYTENISEDITWVWQRSEPFGDLVVWEKFGTSERQILNADISDCRFCDGELDGCYGTGISIHTLSSYPNPFFIVNCNVGAHSRRIMIFDPEKGDEPVFSRTGAYVVHVNNVLNYPYFAIEYDRPGVGDECQDKEEGDYCFVREEVIWPEPEK